MRKVAIIGRGELTERQKDLMNALFGDFEGEVIAQLPTNPKEAGERLKGFDAVFMLFENPNLISVLQTIKRFNPQIDYYTLRMKRIGAFESEEEARRVAEEQDADVVYFNPATKTYQVARSQEVALNPVVGIKADEEVNEEKEVGGEVKRVAVIGPSEPTERQKRLMETFLNAPVEVVKLIKTAPDNPKALSEEVKEADAVLSLVLVAPVVNNLATVKRFTGKPYAVAKVKALDTRIVQSQEEAQRIKEELGADAVVLKETPEGISARFIKTESLLANPVVEVKVERVISVDEILNEGRGIAPSP